MNARCFDSLRFALLPALICATAASALAVPGDLKVMSFNIRTANANDGVNAWDGNRKNLVEQTIRDFGPDIIGFQEDLKRQRDFLEDQFPAYDFVGRGSQGGDDGPYDSVMYRRNRFEKLRHGHFWLSETPDDPGSKSWDSANPRMVTWLELRDSQNPDHTFMYMNMHWDHVGDTARLQSATLVREKVRELAFGIPTIVVGDFNADQGSDPYRRMRGLDDFDTVRNFQDTYRNLHDDADTVGTAHGFDGTAGDRRIDWILHDNDFATLSADIVRTSFDGLYPSDHFPITAVIRPQNVPEPGTMTLVGVTALTLVCPRSRASKR